MIEGGIIFLAQRDVCHLRDIFQIICGITRKFKLRHKIGATKWVVAVPSDCRCSDGCIWWVLGNFGTEEIVAKFENKMFTHQPILGSRRMIIDHLKKNKSGPNVIHEIGAWWKFELSLIWQMIELGCNEIYIFSRSGYCGLFIFRRCQRSATTIILSIIISPLFSEEQT